MNRWFWFVPSFVGLCFLASHFGYVPGMLTAAVSLGRIFERCAPLAANQEQT